MKHFIRVWGQPYEVWVRHELKTGWVATGECEGQQIQALGRTESEALAKWREAAGQNGS